MQNVEKSFIVIVAILREDEEEITSKSQMTEENVSKKIGDVSKVLLQANRNDSVCFNMRVEDHGKTHSPRLSSQKRIHSMR